MELDASRQENDHDWELICPGCHHAVLSTVELCPSCGYDFAAPRSLVSTARASLPAKGTPPEAVSGLADFYARRRKVNAGEFVYAGFWARAAARLIDGVILGGAELVLFLVADSIGAGALLVFVVVLLVFGWAYEPVMTASVGQGTIGKQVMGLAVTDTQGRRLSLGQSYGRFFAEILSAIPLYLGFLLVAFRSDKRALHDLVAGTIVIRL